jgi:alpha-ketoglutarate-dependent taurine dioxygenase
MGAPQFELVRRAASDELGLRRLSPALGVEVTGFAAAILDAPELGAFLHRAVLDHQLLLIRGLELDATALRRLSLSLGALRPVPDGMHTVPGFTDVQRLGNANARVNGSPTLEVDRYALHWHADGTATRKPSRYTLLYAARVPDEGGETSFADMYAACAALSPAWRARLAGRVAIHDPTLARHFRYGDPIIRATTSWRAHLRASVRLLLRMLSPRTTRHPVIRVHEETGRPALFLGDHAWRITRCSWRSGTRMVDELNAFATGNAAWTYTHAWRVGDLGIWDNRCLLHRATEYDTAREERLMLRTVVDGTHPPR